MSEERFLVSASGKLNVDDTLSVFLCQLGELTMQVHSQVGDPGEVREESQSFPKTACVCLTMTSKKRPSCSEGGLL